MMGRVGSRTRSASLGALVLFGLAAACGSKTAGQGSDGSAGAGGSAGAAAGGGGGGASGGGAGTSSSTGGVGGSTGGTGGAAGQGSATSAAGAGGAPTSGAGGAAGAAAPPDLGPTGTDGFAVKVELASDIKATAPTTVGIVWWSLAQAGPTEAHIDFGLDTTYGMTAPVDLTRASYRTVLVGMKPAKTYHFRIVATDGSRMYTSDDRTLATGAPFSFSVLDSFSVKVPGKVDKGFFITSYWNPGSNDPSTWMSFILDTDGDVVWWYVDPGDNSRGETGIGRARLSADSQDVWLARVSNLGAPLRRISIDGLEVQTYTDTVASHDIAAVSGDTMAYLDYGEKDCTSIFEINKAGVTREVFESTGVTATDRTRCHGNSVRYSMKEDDYVFSDDFLDVVVLGRDGTVKWKLGDKVTGGNTSWGGHQHGTQLLDNSLLIFANEAGGDQTKSQAIEFGLDGSVKKKFTSRGGSDFMGDVQRLPSGNTLINYAAGLIQEVDANDAVVLEIQGVNLFGYVEFRQSLYGLPLDISDF
jgi:hypothetical protein